MKPERVRILLQKRRQIEKDQYKHATLQRRTIILIDRRPSGIVPIIEGSPIYLKLIGENLRENVIETLLRFRQTKFKFDHHQLN
jgi:hypothetical protein